ncbi:MAG TPA: HepT-like ribonuclease domain-containing protein [Thermoanaerobaculia bacterium]|nr:HepT-like ribonuclease domain-containing protein [Thermoanaerobaculia bacterium]
MVRSEVVARKIATATTRLDQADEILSRPRTRGVDLRRPRRARRHRPAAGHLIGAVGLRNRIAHGYALLDHARIHDESREGIEHLRRFLVLAADRAGL